MNSMMLRLLTLALLLPVSGSSLLAQDQNSNELGKLLISKGYTSIRLEKIQISDDIYVSTNAYIYAVKCRIGKDDFYLMLDTGSALTIIDEGYAKKIQLKIGDPYKGRAFSMSGEIPLRELKFRSMRVGSLDSVKFAQSIKWYVTDLSFLNQKSEQHDKLPIVGVLGHAYLDNLSAVIDYNSSTLYLITPLRKQWHKLEGSWYPIRGELNTVPLTEEELKTYQLDFANQQLTLSKTGAKPVTYGCHCGEIEPGWLLALYTPEDEAKAVLNYTAGATYKVVDNQLHINLSFDVKTGAPRDFTSPVGSNWLSLVMERRKK